MQNQIWKCWRLEINQEPISFGPLLMPKSKPCPPEDYKSKRFFGKQQVTLATFPVVRSSNSGILEISKQRRRKMLRRKMLIRRTVLQQIVRLKDPVVTVVQELFGDSIKMSALAHGARKHLIQRMVLKSIWLVAFLVRSQAPLKGLEQNRQSA